MYVRDVAYRVTVLLDNQTLEKLHKLGLIPSLPDIALLQLWWHSRVEFLSGVRVALEPEVDWRECYQSLEHKLATGSDKLWIVRDSIAACQLLHRLGHESVSENSLYRAVFYGSINLVRYMIEVRGLDADCPGGHESLLSIACRTGQEECVRFLLTYPEVRVHRDRTPIACQPLSYACRAENGNTDGNYSRIVSMLLADPRTIVDNYALAYACEHTNLEIIELLLADQRVNPSQNDSKILIDSVEQGRVDVVSILLSDPRIDPNNGVGRPLRTAIRTRHLQMIELLMHNETIARYVDSFIMSLARGTNDQRIVELLTRLRIR